MKPLIGALVIIIAMMFGMYSYYNSYPPQANKKLLQASLDKFAAAVATKDRPQVSAALGELLTEDATVHLEVYMFSIRTNQAPPFVQSFDKKQFIQFIDNTLYSLTDYSYTPLLKKYDYDTGAIAFESKEWADGANMMGGIAVNMRYSSDTTCEGTAVFENEVAKLSSANCKMQFRQVPKPGQLDKLQSVESLKDLLLKN